ncbi:hypothetical protein M422DRAFT_250596 [Sphaerobolus stellatus SS14]|uniref:Uncharacterized protein n=1 Tax=Sphaerobolus stellatus (strain SS14) TaxID=990650 RepID=A0A0C9W3L6_SPHS4|nr:hypothetical protein M422DRAFT_250596 [Sphaerobolus stellatus SS14]
MSSNNEIESLLKGLVLQPNHRDALSAIMKARAKGERAAVQLALYRTPKFILSKMVVQEDANNFMRLYWLDGTGNDEVCLNVQGYLSHCSLPTFRPRHKFPRNPLDALQEVKLIGRGVEEFTAVQDAINSVYRLFVAESYEGAYQTLEFDTVAGIPALTFNTRYFMKNKAAGCEVSIPVAMDANGVLQNVLRNRSNALKFTEDNVVNYMRRDTIDGVVMYNSCKPDVFRKGQLVEVQVSFIRIPERDGKRTFRSKLNTVVWMGHGCAIDILDHTSSSGKDVAAESAVCQKRVIPYGDGPNIRRLRTKLDSVQFGEDI